jgi:hypothetical protein
MTLQPRRYICYRSPEPIHLDGALSKPAWVRAPWTEDFLDIQGPDHPKPRFRTRAKLLWDDHCLYIGAELEEPDVWATITQRDAVIFHDNDFEVFIDPDGDGQLYSELEINALNTAWDLLLVRPYRSGGPPVTSWDIKGLRTAVSVNGTLNHPGDRDAGWSVEISIPWESLAEVNRCPCPPRDGDLWRIDFSRVEWHVSVVDGKYEKVPGLVEDNWVWSPMGVIDMHRPERWGVLQFTARTEGHVDPIPYPGLEERQVLAALWEAESQFRHTHGRWAALSDLSEQFPGVTVQFTDDLMEASYRGYRVDQNLRFWRAERP